MNEMVIQILAATAGTVGFAVFFRVKKKHIFLAGLGGLLCWTLYLLSYHFSKSTFIASFVSSFFCSIYSEVLARLCKAPANVFLTPSIIPLIPGGSLYYTMTSLISNDIDEFGMNARLTCAYVFGITTGIVIGAWLFRYITHICYLMLCHMQRKKHGK